MSRKPILTLDSCHQEYHLATPKIGAALLQGVLEPTSKAFFFFCQKGEAHNRTVSSPVCHSNRREQPSTSFSFSVFRSMSLSLPSLFKGAALAAVGSSLFGLVPEGHFLRDTTFRKRLPERNFPQGASQRALLKGRFLLTVSNYQAEQYHHFSRVEGYSSVVSC